MKNMSTRIGPLVVLTLLVAAACTGRGTEVAAPQESVKPTATTATTLDSTTSTPAVTNTTVKPTNTTVKPTNTTVKPTNTTVKPTPTTIKKPKPVAEGSGCNPGSGPLPDGRWYGLLDIAAADELDFDLACYFQGEAAIAAAKEDGQESPPPNDYYVRNVNKTLRTVPVGSSTKVTWYPQSGDPGSQTTTTYGEWLTSRDGDFSLGVWLEVSGGVVTSIEEQWVP